MSKKGKASAEEKVKMVRQYMSGKMSLSQVSQWGGIDTETTREWIRQYETEAILIFSTWTRPARSRSRLR